MPYASSASFDAGADLMTLRRRRSAVSGSLNAVGRAHQSGRTIGDRGSQLEPLARVEQLIEISGWLGGERGADRHGNGEHSHRAPSAFLNRP